MRHNGQDQRLLFQWSIYPMYHTSRRKYYRLDGFLFLGNEEERLRTAIQHMWWQIVMCSLRILLTTSRRNNISNSCRNTISTGQRADYLKQPENISQTAGENSISNNRRNKYHPKQLDNTISDGAREQTFSNSRRTLSDSWRKFYLKQPEEISF